MSDDSLTIAAQVLQTEANGIIALKQSLDHHFTQAIELIMATEDRLIISGMGKSGHIARKIAATLASVGTPAYFVHPGEASHGDLGMICRGDAVMALSNSGETNEMGDLLQFCKRNQIKILGITSGKNSVLAKMSDVALVLPLAPEACPLSLAPTTSTTMMLALGDALAVALLEKRKFTPEDFAMFHPGGKLGQNLLKVSDLMHDASELPLVTAHSKMDDVLIEISTKSFGCAGVMGDDNMLIGVITDGDLRRWFASKPSLDASAGDVMTANSKYITIDALAVEAINLMKQHKITSLFVLNDSKKPIGIIHIHDCLRVGLN